MQDIPLKKVHVGDIDVAYKMLEVFYAESFEKPQMNEIINHIMRLKQKHHITKIYVDGTNPEVIRELKARIGEYHDYYGGLTEEQIWALRSSNSWQIIPINFQKLSSLYRFNLSDFSLSFCQSISLRSSSLEILK